MNFSGRNCEETEQNGFRYLVFDEPKPWKEARMDCEDRGFDLVSITTQDELDFLSSFLKYDDGCSGPYAREGVREVSLTPLPPPALDVPLLGPF